MARALFLYVGNAAVLGNDMRYPTILIAAFLTLPAASANAADARIGVHPRHGEMVLLRDVNARSAYRKAPPSIALIVNPTPNQQLNGMLGTSEMSDDDFAAMSTGSPLSALGTQTDIIGVSLGAAGLGGNTGSAGTGNLGGTLSTTFGGIGGTVTGATRGIGATVNNAFSQFPLGTSQAGGP